MGATAGGHRIRRRERFVQVTRPTVRDGNLSFRALGVLTWLLDRPEGWDVRSAQMSDDGPKREGREAIRTALRELAEAGYYRLERRRTRAGTCLMGTAVSEESVPSWGEQARFFKGRAVPVVEQADGSFMVAYPNGTMLPDDFPPPEKGGEDESDTTGAQEPVPGEPAPRNPAPGEPAPGNTSPLEEQLGETGKESPPNPQTDTGSAEQAEAVTRGEESPFDEKTRTALNAAVERARRLRPGWSKRSITDAMKVALDEGRDPGVVAAAIVAVAKDGASKVPGRLNAEGEWWGLPPVRPARDTVVRCRKRNHETQPADGCPSCLGDAKACPRCPRGARSCPHEDTAEELPELSAEELDRLPVWLRRRASKGRAA